MRRQHPWETLPPALAVAFAILLLPSGLEAQQIRGVVVEDGALTPIAGVTVELLTADSTVRATGISAMTGWFELPTISAGQFFIRVSHPSYVAGGLLGVSVRKDEIVSVIVSMGRVAIPLEPIRVTARSLDRLSGFRERADGRGQGRYIRREEIEKRSAGRPSDLFRMVPEVRIEQEWGPGGVFMGNIVLMRTHGELCKPAIYLDGIPLHGEFGFNMDDVMSIEMLEGVEIYGSHVTAPLELHVPRDNCGIIAFWSRTPRDGGRVTWKRLGAGALIAGMMYLSWRIDLFR